MFIGFATMAPKIAPERPYGLPPWAEFQDHLLLVDCPVLVEFCIRFQEIGVFYPDCAAYEFQDSFYLATDAVQNLIQTRGKGFRGVFQRDHFRDIDERRLQIIVILLKQEQLVVRVHCMTRVTAPAIINLRRSGLRRPSRLFNGWQGAHDAESWLSDHQNLPEPHESS